MKDKLEHQICKGCRYFHCLYCPKTGIECLKCPCDTCIGKVNSKISNFESIPTQKN